MHKYRLYVYDAEDRLIAPAMVISADNDDSASEQAEKMRDGVRVELRDGDRLVMQRPNKERPQFFLCRDYLRLVRISSFFTSASKRGGNSSVVLAR
jgi:hypothetical protein